MAFDVCRRCFRDAVCAHFHCPPEAYEEQVFRHCLYPQARMLAGLIRRLDASYFDSDFELIRFVAGKHRIEDLATEVRLHRLDRPPHTLVRRLLRVRLSGRRLLALGDQLLTPAPATPVADPVAAR